MQVLKQHKRLILLVVLLAAGLIVSLLIVQQVSLPSSKTLPSPTPSSLSPTPTAMSSPTPTIVVPSPSPQPTFSSSGLPGGPTPPPSGPLYPGEVTTYQNHTLTPISDFVGEFIQTSLMTPDINPSTYRLAVTDLVNRPVNFTYSELVNNFEPTEEVVTITCVEGWSATVLWQGVPISALLNETGINPRANTLIFYAADGYSSALPLSYILQNNVILAYKMNNVTLNADTGFPLILVAQNQYGYKWVKYVTEVDVSSDSSYLGYWESRGYPNNATIGNSDGSLTNPYVIAEIVGFSAVAIVVAVACYLILTKVRKKYSSQKGNEQISVRARVPLAAPAPKGKITFFIFLFPY